jgi:hypothetical protein
MSLVFNGCCIQDVLDAYGMFVLLNNFLNRAYESMKRYTSNEFAIELDNLSKAKDLKGAELRVQDWIQKISYISDVYRLFRTGQILSANFDKNLLQDLSHHLKSRTDSSSVRFIHPSMHGSYKLSISSTPDLAMCCEDFLINILNFSKSYKSLFSKADKERIDEQSEKVCINKYILNCFYLFSL